MEESPSGPVLAASTLALWAWHSPVAYADAFAHPPSYWWMQASLLAVFTGSGWLGYDTRISADDFDVIDNQIGESYDVPTPASLADVRLAGMTEGLVLDPIYNGKGLGAVRAEAEAGRIGAPASRSSSSTPAVRLACLPTPPASEQDT